MAQGEYAMCSSSVNTVTSASLSVSLANEAAVMPAAPEPTITIFLPMFSQF